MAIDLFSLVYSYLQRQRNAHTDKQNKTKQRKGARRRV
jgi:hypothetical protein